MDRRAWATGFRIAMVQAVVSLSSLGFGCASGAKPEAAAAKSATGTPAPAMPGKNVPAIKVNTVGYPTGWRKVAIFNVEPQQPRIEDEGGKVVHQIASHDVRSHGLDAASQDAVWQADFTAFNTPGRYRIASQGAVSDVFVIAGRPYESALRLAQKHFYFQRCRTALQAPHALHEGDTFTRDTPCHTHDDVGWDLRDFPDKKRKWKLYAGWHDAGNFEMYVPSTAPTAQALLMAYASHPKSFADGDLDIPESGNGVPDILDEAKWGLEWVLSMQEGSGGFRLGEAVRDWSQPGPADEERKARWVSGVGTASTAKASAALAVAARTYREVNPKFAQRAERASKAAWAFLEKHPERIVVDGKGSKQPLWDDSNEYASVAGQRFMAAVEVWRSFRNPAALERAQQLLADPQTQPAELIKGAWTNLSRWGLMTLALDDQAPAALRAEARTRLLSAAETLREQIEQSDGYRCATRPSEYYWGHNSNLMERAHLLLVVAKLAPDVHWLREAARDQWHWILGRNPNGYSMVSRVGKGPDRIYHCEWGKRPRPVPGYLTGGPNAVQGKFLSPHAPAKALLWDNPFPLRSGLPPHSLWHSEQSDLWDAGFVPEDNWETGWWVVNEPDIYYNGNLVLVAAEVQN